jgi:hypothetical protein
MLLEGTLCGVWQNGMQVNQHNHAVEYQQQQQQHAPLVVCK